MKEYFKFSEEKDKQMDEQLKKNYTTPEGKAKHRRNVRIGFCITLVILLLASFINWGIVTSWGDVRVDRIKVIGTDGAEYSALVYVPKNATNKTPAPAILCFHGNAGNARNHESWSVEFSRRGFVVLAVDQFGAGNSQGHFDGGQSGALSEESLTAVGKMFTEYVLSMPIVDKENIIFSGHSMGTTTAVAMGSTHLDNCAVILGASPVIILDKEGEYAAAWDSYVGNYVDLTGLVESNEAKKCEEGLKMLQKRPGFENATEFKLETVYGSFEEGTGYVAILEPERIHEAAFVNQMTIGNLLYYGQLSVGDAVPNYIDSADQVWMYKDYAGLFGIFAFAAFLCAVALLLIEEVPFFADVKRPIARNIGLRKVGFAISVAMAIVFPYIVLKTDAFGIIGGRFFTNLREAGFELGYSNMAFGVLVGLNLLGVLGFLLYFFTDGKKVKLRLDDLGVTPEGYENMGTGKEKALGIGKMVLKTVLLSAIVVAICFGYAKLQSEVLGTDFYAWFFGVKDIHLSKIPYYWNYILVWILCFGVASMTLNVERRLPSTGNETLDTILQVVINVVLATFTIILVVVVKWELQSAGSPADTNAIWKMGVDTQRIWGMPVGMAVGVGGSTFLYKKTGNTWLSAILMGTVAALMCITFGGTRFHFLTYFVG